MNEQAEQRVLGRLRANFALLACLGGIVLGTVSETESLPVIAVFFAAFGFVFVDWLRLFSLPPTAAYIGMGLAAVYCVANFLDGDEPGNYQIVAVARLLVMVQSILMLQVKSHRVFEQLAVFCLLELIVAAVFNDAISYGLLLIPIGLVGVWALSSLAALTLVDDRSGRITRSASGIRCTPSPDDRLNPSTPVVPLFALLAVAPAVVLVAGVFFYALPRTTDASRVRGPTNALVGFSDRMNLEQIGQMQLSDALALRIQLSDAQTGDPYVVRGGLYLRGKVFETYDQSKSRRDQAAVWSSTAEGPLGVLRSLPREFHPPRSSDHYLYDSVDVAVTCEPLRSPTLFAIAPYHATALRTDLVHETDRWTIRRSENASPGLSWSFPRIKYRFGTNGFTRERKQSELTTRSPGIDPWRWSANQGVAIDLPEEADALVRAALASYRGEITRFDSALVPTALAFAEAIATGIPSERRTTYEIAKQFERFLSTTGGFRYTLNLNAEELEDVDPIEQFLAIDRRGHCQFFASGLVMMLRSLGIPARIVVGYRTNEYSELGQIYMARQYHAHAWVEALIDKDQLPSRTVVYGQKPAEEYWLRLDPTPGNDSPGGGPTSNVRQAMDVAQTLWDDYIVEMDGTQQQETLLNAPAVTPITNSFAAVVRTVTDVLRRMGRGELGGGSLSGRQLFSWPAALAAITTTLVVVCFSRFRLPGWLRFRVSKGRRAAVARPSLAFYAETLDQLARLGIHRTAAQTPAELADAAAVLDGNGGTAIAGPVTRLTSAFYRLRYRDPRAPDRLTHDPAPAPASAQLADFHGNLQHELQQLELRVDELIQLRKQGTQA